MSSRAAALVAGGEDRAAWAEAGDQLFADLDLSEVNLPPGTRLGIGDAVLEVSAEPHLGCGKFIRRFGVDAMKLVNSERGRALRLRGLNARVVEAGEVAIGDPVSKLS
jgi:MOSC domain-containing protein YiiM